MSGSVPTESKEQIDLFAWASKLDFELGRVGQFMFAIPNEGKRSKVMGARMKAQGLKSGVPDICLALPRDGKPGLFIEMKRIKGSTTTENQKRWIDRLKSVGYEVHVCKGAEEAKAVITDYIGAA